MTTAREGGESGWGEGPGVLDSLEHQRQRELLKARLFGLEAQPMRLGRFVLLHRLGAGGMGVVYVAYDERLDRKVAVKMLHSRRHGGGEEAQRVLLREAQALGRLSHPNVVTVHEVGVHEGRVFLAMEFVAGQTLRAWQQERPRTVEETLRVYRQAGAGLAAAHACGLVHRDFKPENVMVSDDGRVRVLDFGLARSAPSAGEAGDEGEPPASHPQAGTPAYMAPEQHEGQGVDARTDQFAFCVALHEALHGERPFEGTSLEALRAQVCAGQVRAPRRGRVPRWVQAALRRGLQPDPARRWPSMQALLRALEAHPLARWRRGAAAAALALGAVGLLALGRWAARPACDGAAAKLTEVWGPAQREAVRQAVLGAGGGQGAFVWERLDGALRQYHQAWSAGYTQACLAHRRGELSPGLLDASMSCLEQRRGELRALVGVLSGRAGPVALDQVLPSVQTLERVALCADRSWLGSRIAPPDRRLAPDVERLRARLTEGKALGDAGLLAQGARLARDAVAEARALAYEPLLAQALLLEGTLELRRQHPDLASNLLDEAYHGALRAHDDETAAMALVQQLSLSSQRDLMITFWPVPWAEIAAPIVARVGRDDLQASFLLQRGLERLRKRAVDQADDDLAQAHALFERSLGAAHPAVADALHARAQVALARGRQGDRLALEQQAIALLEQALGPEHPRLSPSLRAAGSSLRALGRPDEGIALLRRSLAIEERRSGQDDSALFDALMALEHAAHAAGQVEQAGALARRAAALVSADAQKSSERRMMHLRQVGAELVALGQFADVEALLDRELGRLGGSDLRLSYVLEVRARLRLRLGRDDEARDDLLRVVDLVEHALGDRSPQLVSPLLELGLLALRRGPPAHAVERLERAVRLSASLGNLPLRADCRLALARALPAAQRARARDLASEALSDYEHSEPPLAEQANDARSWLASHPP